MKTKVFIGLSTLLFIYVILAPAISPANAETSVSITGNGTGSNNYVGVTETSSSNIDQSNTGIISNIINIFTSTGDNSSSGNTGSNSSTNTGNATSSVTVENDLNYNYAEVDNCCTSCS